MSTQHGDDGAPAAGGPPAQSGPLAAGARELLAGLDEAPLEEHVRVYDGLHRRLAAALEPPAGPPVPGPAGRRS